VVPILVVHTVTALVLFHGNLFWSLETSSLTTNSMLSVISPYLVAQGDAIGKNGRKLIQIAIELSDGLCACDRQLQRRTNLTIGWAQLGLHSTDQ